MDDRYLILMHGYTGVGKTTAAHKISNVLRQLGFPTEVINNNWLYERGTFINQSRYELPTYFSGVNQIRHNLFLNKVRAAEAEIKKGSIVILDTTSKHQVLRENVYELVGEYMSGRARPVRFDNFFVIHCKCPLNAAIAGLLQKEEFKRIINRMGFEKAVKASMDDLRFEVRTTEKLSSEEKIRGQYSPKTINYQTLDETVSITNYHIYDDQDHLEKRKLSTTEQNSQEHTYEAAHKYLIEKYVPDLEQTLQKVGYFGKDWVLETIIAALAEKTRQKKFVEMFNTDTELKPEEYVNFLKMKQEETRKIQQKMGLISGNLGYAPDSI